MDVLDFINNRGQVEVKNPNYNPKSKKNTEPPTLIVPDFGATQNQVLDIVRKDLTNQISAPTEELKKYRRYGLNWNPNDDMDLALSEAQSTGAKMFNSLVQTVSELTLGTVTAGFDLMDMIGNAFTKNDNDYQNPITRTLVDWQEAIRNDVAPIYVTPGMSIDEGGLYKWGSGWIASNIPSLASSLTLLIPSMAITRGVPKLFKTIAGAAKLEQTASKAAKLKKGEEIFSEFGHKALRTITGADRAINEGRTLNAAQRYLNSARGINTMTTMGEAFISGSLQRIMENYQESRQTYDDMLPYSIDVLTKMRDTGKLDNWIANHADELDGVDTGNITEIAKRIASNAADKTFRIDMLNAGFDIFQMYLLRNSWKGLARPEHIKASVRDLNKQAAKEFGKAAANTAETAKIDWLKKAGKWTKNKLYDSPWVVKAQLSEGVEEAVNYVAQQEGMTYGKVLLEQEQVSSFDTRLESYIKNPQLHDAAFWGVLGGVVFQGLGSKFNQLQRTNELKARYKALGIDFKANKDIDSFIGLADLSDVEAQKTSIQNTAINTKNFLKNLADIESGTDIYTSDRSKFTSNVEKEKAKQRLWTDYITDVTISAKVNGTLSLAKEFLADENVMNAFADAGVMSKEDAQSFVNSTLTQMEDIDHQMDNELIKLSHASAYLKQTVPAEYLCIIASQNIQSRAKIKNLEETVKDVKDRISELKAQESNIKLFEQLGFNEDMLKTNEQLVELSRLYVQRKYYQDTNKDGLNLSARISLQKINKQIETIENSIEYPNVVYATALSLGMKVNDKGEIVNVDEKELKEKVNYIDRLLVNRQGQIAGNVQTIEGLDFLNDKYRKALTDAEVDDFRKIQKAVSNDGTLQKFREANPELYTLLINESEYTKAINAIKSDIVDNTDDLKREVENLDESMNIAKRDAINLSRVNIVELYKKYGNVLKKAINDFYDNAKDFTNNNTTLEEKDKNTLIQALKVLDITNQTDNSSIDNIFRLFDKEDALKASQKQTDTELKNEGRDNSPQAGQKPPKSSENGQNGGISDPNLTQPKEILLSENGKTYAKLKPTDSDNLYELEIVDKNHTKTIELLNNVKFYQKQTDIISDNWEITSKPIVFTKNGKLENSVVREKGIISPKAATSQSEEQYDEYGNPIASFSSTGGEEQTYDEVPAQAPNPAEIDDTLTDEDFFSATTISTSIVRKGRNLLVNYPDATDEQIDKFINDLIEGDADYSSTTLEIQAFARKQIEGALRRMFKANKSNKVYSKVVDIFNPEVKKLDAYINLLQAYADTTDKQKFDGKYYIHVDNLLRYIKDLFNINKNSAKDDIIIKALYNDMLVLSKNGKAKQIGDFVICDMEAVTSDPFLSHIYDDRINSLQDKLKDSTFDIDVTSYSSYVQDDDNRDAKIQAFFEGLDELNDGDELEFGYLEVDGEEDEARLQFMKNGKVVGTTPIARRVVDEPNKTGVYHIINEGWNIDILTDGNDNIVESKVRDLFKSIMLDSKYKKLFDIIWEYTYNDKANLSQLYDNFVDAVKTLGINNFIYFDKKRNDYRYDEALWHLSKLFRYIQADYSDIFNAPDEIKDELSQNIDIWFEYINNHYGLADEIDKSLQGGKTVKVTVAKAPNIYVRFTDKDDFRVMSEALPVNPNLDIYKIAVAKKPGLLDVSGKGSFSFIQNDRKGLPYLIVYEKGSPKVAFAHVVSVKDKTISEDAKHIVNVAKADLIKELQNAISNKTPIKNAFYKYFTTTTSNKKLFGGVKLKSENGIITFKKENTELGRIEKGEAKINNEFVSIATLVNTIFDNAIFNISFGGISDDSKQVNTKTQDAGFYRENGKLVIEVGDEKFVYDSYNQFIISNNLLKVTLQRSEDGKSNRMTSKEAAENGLSVRWTVAISTPPVEEMNENNISTTNTSAINVNATRDSIFNILNSKKHNKGYAILDLLPNTSNTKKQLLKVKSFLDNAIGAYGNKSLLPANIKYKEELGDKYYAEYSIGTDITYVSPKWIELFEKTPETAIKKLIHERLHAILNNGNEEYIDRVKSIYNEYKSILDNKDSERYKQLINLLSPVYSDNSGVTLEKYLRQYLFEDTKNETERWEDFLIESLTSNSLSFILNNIESENIDKSNNKKNLLQRIFEFLSDLFGWGINENSLYEKEFYALSDVFDNTPITNVEGEKTDVEKEKEPENEDEEDEDDIIKPIDARKFSTIEDKFAKNGNDINLGNFSNINTFLSTIPFEDRAQIKEELENGNINITCK